MTTRDENAGSADANAPTANQDSFRKVLVLGLRRAGKSSLCKVVYENFQPNDTLFLPPTARVQKYNIATFQHWQLWDIPGTVLLKGGDIRDSDLLSGIDVAWSDVQAIIFVIDAQDDYYDALDKLNAVILGAYKRNHHIHMHVFINKVDGLSEDYKFDTQRDVEQRVAEALIDLSNDVQGPDGEPVQLDRKVSVRFYLTSVFDSSVFVAFSRIQQCLLHGRDSDIELLTSANTSEPSAHSSAPPTPRRFVSLHEALENACILLCSSCHMEKAYVFDVPSRTFVAADTSPFDAPLFEVMFEYIKFLRSFSKLYANAPAAVARNKPIRTNRTRDWSASVMRLSGDTCVAFWQLDRYAYPASSSYFSHLSLLAVVRSSIQMANSGILVRISGQHLLTTGL